MSPEDVPEELVRLFDDGSLAGACTYKGDNPAISENVYFRGGLAAVLPAHRQMVIDQIACQPPGTVVMTDAELAEHDAVIRQQVRAEVAKELAERYLGLAAGLEEIAADGGMPRATKTGGGSPRNLRADARHLRHLAEDTAWITEGAGR